ncbi:MAG: hypothetical protein K2K25_02600 [Muribaculaceae bacterium]|nr:hypothetical protein [Muribaculaceae bacterium]
MDASNYYKDQFRDLNVNRSGNKVAPHKAILLLSVIELIENGFITTPFIEISKPLEDRFKQNWRKYVSKDRGYSCKMYYPFFHLSSSPFWELVKTESYDKQNEYSSMKSLRRNFKGAVMASDLFGLIQSPIHRENLKIILIKTYLSY